MTGTTDPSAKVWLHAEADRLIGRLWVGIRKTPDAMSARLRRLILEGQQFKVMDLEDFVDVLKPIADADPLLKADLTALEGVTARLGSHVMAMRVERRGE